MSAPWLAIARRHIGEAEIPGPRSNSWIAGLWRTLGGEWLWRQLGSDDSRSPWCGTFAAAVMREAGVPLPKHWYRARAWLEWGMPIDEPALGCIVVYERGGAGHVGFVVGEDPARRLLTLGGNQGDKVSIARFDRTRVLGYRWPITHVAGLLDAFPIPKLAANGQPSSGNEA